MSEVMFGSSVAGPARGPNTRTRQYLPVVNQNWATQQKLFQEGSRIYVDPTLFLPCSDNTPAPTAADLLTTVNCTSAEVSAAYNINLEMSNNVYIDEVARDKQTSNVFTHLLTPLGWTKTSVATSEYQLAVYGKEVIAGKPTTRVVQLPAAIKVDGNRPGAYQIRVAYDRSGNNPTHCEMVPIPGVISSLGEIRIDNPNNSWEFELAYYKQGQLINSVFIPRGGMQNAVKLGNDYKCFVTLAQSNGLASLTASTQVSPGNVVFILLEADQTFMLKTQPNTSYIDVPSHGTEVKIERSYNQSPNYY